MPNKVSMEQNKMTTPLSYTKPRCNFDLAIGRIGRDALCKYDVRELRGQWFEVSIFASTLAKGAQLQKVIFDSKLQIVIA